MKALLTAFLACLIATTALAQPRFSVHARELTSSPTGRLTATAWIVDRQKNRLWQCTVNYLPTAWEEQRCHESNHSSLPFGPNSAIIRAEQTGTPAAAIDAYWAIDEMSGTVHYCDLRSLILGCISLLQPQ